MEKAAGMHPFWKPGYDMTKFQLCPPYIDKQRSEDIHATIDSRKENVNL
jgi:hypothetical protein